MKKLPAYDSHVPRQYYDSFGEKESTRLSRDCPGELLYHVHMDVLRCYVDQQVSVLELGAGAGMFSKELAMLAKTLVVSDISHEQLTINKLKMTDMLSKNYSSRGGGGIQSIDYIVLQSP